MKGKTNDNFVDVLKLIFSLCVVGIHTGVLYALPDLANWYVMHLVFRIAVPFFIVASAYYLGSADCKNVANINQVFKRYRLRLIPPLLLWGGGG